MKSKIDTFTLVQEFLIIGSSFIEKQRLLSEERLKALNTRRLLSYYKTIRSKFRSVKHSCWGFSFYEKKAFEHYKYLVYSIYAKRNDK